MILSILISTTDCKLLKNKSFLSLPFNENFTALVVNQKINSEEDLQIENEWVSVVNTFEKGISNSRNMALKHAKADYVHFCDDDVEFFEEYESTVRQAIKKHPNVDFFQFQVAKDEKRLYKKYTSKSYVIKDKSWNNKRKVLQISSIEIIGKLSSIKEKKLRFNPMFGIGGKEYESGEEVVFLLDALEKKCIIRYIPQPIVLHKEEGTGQKMNVSQLSILGYLFRQIYGSFTPLFNVYYAFKKRRELKTQGISIRKALKKMNER